LDYDKLAALVRASLPTNEPFVLLGESFSGPVAIALAASNPRGLRGLILCASFTRNPHPYFPRWCAPIVSAPLFGLFPHFARAKALLGGYSTPTLRELSRKALAQVQPRVLAHRVRCVLRVDVGASLCACPVPVLYLRGTRDLVVPGWNLSKLRKNCADLQVATIRAPHMVLQTRPLESAAAICSFIDQKLRPGR